MPRHGDRHWWQKGNDLSIPRFRHQCFGARIRSLTQFNAGICGAASRLNSVELQRQFLALAVKRDRNQLNHKQQLTYKQKINCSCMQAKLLVILVRDTTCIISYILASIFVSYNLHHTGFLKVGGHCEAMLDVTKKCILFPFIFLNNVTSKLGVFNIFKANKTNIKCTLQKT